MKLTKVFFLFIFSSTVLFVGAVDNVLSARIVDGPYFADATARRVQVANVLAHARVSCSNPHTINGYYSMYIWKDFDTDRQAVNWRIIDGTFNYVNGVF